MGVIGRILEWDEDKRRRNLRKHGLDFAYCAAVFNAPAVTRVDDRYDYGETRFVTLGLLDGHVVSVAHTLTDESVRIISLRKATKSEQARYFQTIQD